MENENFDNKMSQYKILCGPWINTNTPVFVFFAFEKDVEDNKILREMYILIPKNSCEQLINEKIGPISLITYDIFGGVIDIATNHIRSELNMEISRDKRDIYPDLFPYKLHEIEISKLMDYYKLIVHEKLGQEFLSCLGKIECDTHCNILKDLLANLRECFERN